MVAAYGYFFWIYSGTMVSNNLEEDFHGAYCALGALGQDICIHPELNRVSVQQRDGQDPMGSLVTTPVAFDKNVSFTAFDVDPVLPPTTVASPAAQPTLDSSATEWDHPLLCVVIGSMTLSFAAFF